MRKCPPGTCSANVLNANYWNLPKYIYNICIVSAERYQTSAFSGKLPFPGSWFPGSQISREVKFPGKSNYPGSHLFREVTFPVKSPFPGSHFSWEDTFPGKSPFPGSHISREVSWNKRKNVQMSQCPQNTIHGTNVLKNWWRNIRRTDGEWNAPVDLTASLQVKRLQTCFSAKRDDTLDLYLGRSLSQSGQFFFMSNRSLSSLVFSLWRYRSTILGLMVSELVPAARGCRDAAGTRVHATLFTHAAALTVVAIKMMALFALPSHHHCDATPWHGCRLPSILFNSIQRRCPYRRRPTAA